MNEEQIIILAKKWYSFKTISINLIKQFKNREVIFKSTKNKYMIRWIKINFSEYFKKYSEAYGLYKYQSLIYHSLAEYPYLPIMSINSKIRKEQQQEWNREINENPTKHIKKPFLALDFDGDGIEQLEAVSFEVQKVKRDLDRFKIPYQLKFSGKKGFHIIIPFEVMPDLPSVEYYIEFYKLIAEKLMNKYHLGSLDISIYDLKRIIKTAYSIDFRTLKICMPLSDYELEHFKIEDYDLRNWYNLVGMAYKKGLYFLHYDSPINIIRKRFLYWIDYIDKVS